ncbi:2-dehydropantoate 2-reductase [Prauserella cavernicola]|uniref:2-dehydropantoate 2-reductase n=1 Tax=Prauserella cavernicola TaxID=2800127 RepID=A0A934QQ56_9PSEU|nr:2-dehydropantoate 2-reductase [Prauserella cavernicola]MBK1784320.1 2-dehydropantoate 2-reductase [Prauserella cavernicola]
MSTPETVAVVGMGAVGTALAVALADRGHPVVACGRSRLDRVEVTDQGAARGVDVDWAATPADVEPVPWTLLTTKIHHTPSVADWLARLTAGGGRVVVAQNGVDHAERVGPLVNGADVVPALVYINAERTAPGHARIRRTERDLVLPADEPGTAAARLFERAGLAVDLRPDFRTAAWHKLLTNVAANPLTALTGRRVEVLTEPAVAELALRMLREAVAVGRAEGAELTDDDAIGSLAWLQALAPGSTSSMLQDREAGRTLEYEGLTGTLVRLGERHGIDVEANRAVYALLSAISA